MTIKARRLEALKTPEKTALYEVRDSREIAVEEKQKDGSLDQVILEYQVGKNAVGYFAKEYRPADVPKTGAQVIDITAVMLDHTKKSVRWHLYDIKDTLAGEHTVVKLYDQWNSGLRYLQNNILSGIPGYTVIPDLGVITRNYDKERMKRLRSNSEKRYNEIRNNRQGMTLSRRKKRTEIARYKGVLKAVRAILNKNFQTEDRAVTYSIHIKQLLTEPDQVYKIKFPV